MSLRTHSATAVSVVATHRATGGVGSGQCAHDVGIRDNWADRGDPDSVRLEFHA